MNNIKRVEDYKRKFSNETKEADYCKRNLSIWGEKKPQPNNPNTKTKKKKSKPIKTNNNHQIFEHSQAKPKLI